MKQLSKQRRWQLKQLALGRCITCGGALVTRHHCLKHAVAARERQRARKGFVRRYRSASYRLSA